MSVHPEMTEKFSVNVLYLPLTLCRSRVSSPRTKAQSSIHKITTISNIYLLLKILSPSRRNLQRENKKSNDPDNAQMRCQFGKLQKYTLTLNAHIIYLPIIGSHVTYWRSTDFVAPK